MPERVGAHEVRGLYRQIRPTREAHGKKPGSRPRLAVGTAAFDGSTASGI
jgi:hypothetical protein